MRNHAAQLRTNNTEVYVRNQKQHAYCVLTSQSTQCNVIVNMLPRTLARRLTYSVNRYFGAGTRAHLSKMQEAQLSQRNRASLYIIYTSDPLN